ncbi:MAG: hypothetical protein Q9M28_11215, partial [Mariprofundaceae bacterium]|nr:hypothetical protein [Mariprofundaceae bacterium]
MDKQALLTLLDEKDVQQKILKLIHEDEKTEPTNDEMAHLRQQLHNHEQEKDEMSQLIEKIKSMLGLKERALEQKESENSTQSVTINQLSSKKSGLEKDLQEKLSANKTLASQLQEKLSDNATLQEKLNFYRKHFEQDLMMYEKYQSLRPQTQSALKNIFKSNDLSGFLSCGVQERNIQNFWEYIKTEMIEDRNHNDMPSLQAIFSFFFERFILAFDMYERLDSKAGDRFDTKLHIKHHQSAQSSGEITAIYLQGYRNHKTNK